MTPTLTEFFRNHKDYDNYISVHGHDRAFGEFKHQHYAAWLDIAFPPEQETRLTESDCLELAELWDYEPVDTIRLLAIGQKLKRWVLPDVR